MSKTGAGKKIETKSLNKYSFFIRKEFFHIFRDKRTMLILLAMPIIQIIIFGFAISTEVKNSRLAVYDPTKSMETQNIISQLDASEYFSLTSYLESPNEVDLLFRQNSIDMAIIFDPNFGTSPSLQIIADGSDPNTATIATSYMTTIINSQTVSSSPIEVTTSFLYNPSMQSSYNFVPGVMGLILMLICAMMTSISIVREKERGTMEVLLVSPIHPVSVILAKMVPYLTISMVNLCTILLLSVFVLGVPISGSLGWLFAFSLLFVFVALALGILISTLVKSQVLAMILSGMVLMMPTMVLSGMLFPIESMPKILQIISSFIPARWYIEGVRKLMIQGVGVEYVIREFIVLGSMAAVLLTISLKNFKIRL